tara:strand:- start:1652 stop:2419 length:768 start_codon:yes stop_codon:yes gene_type:complete
MAPNDSIKINIQQLNPKKKGTKAYDRYEKYKKATTIKEAKELGALSVDFKWDMAAGYIKVYDDSLSALNKLCYDLLKQNQQLVNRIEELEDYVRKQRKRNNYIEFLEQFKPTVTFEKWLPTIKITDKHFEILYECTLIQTMIMIFKNYHNDDLHGIFKCFNEKHGVFYVYTNDVWSKIDDVQFQSLFDAIYKPIYKYFQQWETECFESGSDGAMMRYMDVNLKVNVNTRECMEKFKSKLYNDLKISFRNHYKDDC